MACRKQAITQAVVYEVSGHNFPDKGMAYYSRF